MKSFASKQGFSLGQMMIGMIVSSIAIWSTTEFITSTNQKQIKIESQSLLDAVHLNTMDEIMFYDKSSTLNASQSTGLSSALRQTVEANPNLKSCLLGKGTACNSTSFTGDTNGNGTFDIIGPGGVILASPEGFLYPPNMPTRFNGFVSLRAGVSAAGAPPTCAINVRNCIQQVTRYRFICTALLCSTAQVTLVTRYVGADLKLAVRSNTMSVPAFILTGTNLSIASCTAPDLATRYAMDNTGKGQLQCTHTWNGFSALATNPAQIFYGSVNASSNVTPAAFRAPAGGAAPCPMYEGAFSQGISSGNLFEESSTTAYTCTGNVSWRLSCVAGTPGCVSN